MSIRLAAWVLGGVVVAGAGVAAVPALAGLGGSTGPSDPSDPALASEPTDARSALAVIGPPAHTATPAASTATDDPVAEEEPDPDDEPEEDDDGYWVGPPDAIPDCEAKLEAAGVEFSASRLPLHKTKGGMYCGAEQVVRYRKGPGHISWGGRPKVTCAVALGMAQLETIVQQEAEREFGRPVRRIQHMGTYNCREMANYPGWVSEHSYANAIDIKHFELKGGKKIPVLGEYPRNGAEPSNAKARFLGQVARRLYDEKVFSVVLTPSFDRAHRNHFHLDMARYLVDGT